MSKKPNLPHPINETKRAYWALLIFVVLTVVAPYLLTRDFGWIEFESTGQIGDTIGGITSPIVGLLGAYLVYKALIAQIAANKELTRQFGEQQRNTIAQLQLQVKSNELIEKQFQQQLIDSEEQTRLILRQNFEQNFFQLISIHHDIIKRFDTQLIPLLNKFYPYYTPATHGSIQKKLEIGSINTRLTDYDFFKTTAKLLLTLITIQQKDLVVDNSIIGYEPVKYRDRTHFFSYKKTYKLLYKELDVYLGLYFRNFQIILETIEKQKFHPLKDTRKEPETKRYYSSILRAQLTDYEVIWLFFHGLNNETGSFRRLIQKYGMLEALSNSEIPEIQLMKYLYPDEAYQK